MIISKAMVFLIFNKGVCKSWKPWSSAWQEWRNAYKGIYFVSECQLSFLETIFETCTVDVLYYILPKIYCHFDFKNVAHTATKWQFIIINKHICVRVVFLYLNFELRALICIL